MQSVAILTLLLVASSASASSQPQGGEQPAVASPQQPAETDKLTLLVPEQKVVQPQASVVGSVVPVQVEHHHHHQQQAPPAPVVGVEHVAQPQASYYAPAGVIQVVGAEQQQAGAKPVPGQAVRNQPEQYGQPEPASIPPNYKPFGSWGLYIGGNPADGYYTNYYKQLSNSVDKQQQQQQQVTPAAALNPMLRQAGSSPYVGADYYPFAYSTADFNANVNGRPYGVEPQQPAAVQVIPSAYAPFHEGHAQPDHYAATKQLGAAGATKTTNENREVQQQQVVQSGKGSHAHQARFYAYPSPAQVVGQLSAQGVANSVVSSSSANMNLNSNSQGHVVAYPVPIGSQIVGSQQGVDGAFGPYGVHAFTRYAVKPALVGRQPDHTHAHAHHYYYSQPAQQLQPAYKQSQQGYYYPAPYPHGYAYAPVVAGGQQLYYSQPAVGPQPIVHDGPAYFGPVPVEQFGGDKVVEDGVVENKPQQVQVVNKPQQS